MDAVDAHRQGAGTPLAAAMEKTLAVLMDDRITSMKQYFQEQAAHNQKLNERIATLEEQAAEVDDLKQELEEAWQRIEALEKASEQQNTQQVDELEQKVQDLAEVIEQGMTQPVQPSCHDSAAAYVFKFCEV